MCSWLFRWSWLFGWCCLFGGACSSGSSSLGDNADGLMDVEADGPTDGENDGFSGGTNSSGGTGCSGGTGSSGGSSGGGADCLTCGAASVHSCHNDMEFLDLFQQLGYRLGDKNWQTPKDWLQEDADDPGYQLMTDAESYMKFWVEQL